MNLIFHNLIFTIDIMTSKIIDIDIYWYLLEMIFANCVNINCKNWCHNFITSIIQICKKYCIS